MKRIFAFVCLSLMLFGAFAVTEYDIGGGQKLVLNDDGTYQIVAAAVDASPVVGKQYRLDYSRTLDLFIDLAIASDPSIAFYGRDTISSLLESYIGELPPMSIIFLSAEKMLAIIDGDQSETSYRITSGREVYVTKVDGSGEDKLGTLSEDYKEITVVIEGMPAYFVQVE